MQEAVVLTEAFYAKWNSNTAQVRALAQDSSGDSRLYLFYTVGYYS